MNTCSCWATLALPKAGGAGRRRPPHVDAEELVEAPVGREGVPDVRVAAGLALDDNTAPERAAGPAAAGPEEAAGPTPWWLAPCWPARGGL